jgi:cytidylate kinase
LRTKNLVIAIDGPAAAGKSTTARLVAKALNYLHVDTGAMYRAVTLKVLRSKIDPGDSARVEEIARKVKIELKSTVDGSRVDLDGEDVTSGIRDTDVTRHVSVVSRMRGVRDAMVCLQREIGSSGGVVLEGRDIGTVVFPDADLKIFLIANLDERAKRRRDELRARGRETPLDLLREEIRMRDELDSTREMSPLVKAPDAIELDTSGLTIEEQVAFVTGKAKELLHKMDHR